MPGVRGIYDRHKFLEEMQLAYDSLSALIDSIVDPKDNVLPIRGKRRKRHVTA